MTDQTHMPYASVRATPDIVDRTDILDQIYAAISDPSDVTYVFYITAKGGWGKTRLVEEVLCRLQKVRRDSPPESPCPGKWYSPDILAANRPVDLYHMSTHSEEGLAYEIYEALAPANPDCFVEYLKQRKKLEEVKFALSEILREVNQQHERMIQAFISDFNRLNPAYRRTVLALDTAETLVYETDRVQQVLGLAEEPMGVASWLLRDFLPNIKNTVVLLAGRPEETPRLAEALEKIPDIRFIRYELRLFTEEESLEYIQAMAEEARNSGELETAQRIDLIPEETRRVLHLYSGGQPLLLALMLDYLAMTDELILEANAPLDEAREQTSAPDSREQIQNKVRAAIVQRIVETRRPADDVIRMLALTPKGMEPELLARLLKLDSSVTEAEVDAARMRLAELKEPRLSFIKTRPDDERVFLHDEMYDMLGPAVRESLSPGHQKKVDGIIQSYCVDKVKEARERVSEAGAVELMPDSSKPGTTGPLFSLRPPVLSRELFQARVKLQARQVDEVFYALRRDVNDGFEVYYKYAEEAFQNNDDSLHWQLRDQILGFRDPLAKQPDAARGTGKLRSSDIERDVGLRWIKPNVVRGMYDIALAQIDLFRRECGDLIREGGTLAKAEIDIWEGFALTFAGAELGRARELLQGAISQLESISGIPARLRRRNRLLADAHTYLAYAYRVQGHFREAIEEYNRALPILRELTVLGEHANALNNLSWAEAEIGHFDAALEHCEDALRIRHWLGKRYTIALSLNTFGLIQMRNGQPDRAYGYCRQAWDIFRDLGQPRGVGLASTALAETLRRMATLPYLFTPEQAMTKLREGDQYAREAVRIFDKEIKEPMRLVEALIELGCTYREMVRLGREHELIDDRVREVPHLVYPSTVAGRGQELIDDRVREGFARAGEQAFRRAAEEASGSFAYRKADALVNLAWLRYYNGDGEGAEKILRGPESEVLPVIPIEYLIVRGEGPREVRDPIEWFWTQLGKANLLLGQIAFDKYEQRNKALKDQEVPPQGRSEVWLHLMEAARMWTLALAYDRRYGESFRDLKAGLRRIYNALDGLNIEAMGVFCESAAQTIQNYRLPPDLQLMRHFLVERFGCR